MRYGVSVSIATTAAPRDTVTRVEQLEQVGLDAVWMGQLFGVDTLTVFALAGQTTSRISMGTAVIPTYSRHPLVLASQALTAQAATTNRIVLGIGSSHRLLVEDTMGLTYDRPARHLREYLQVLRPALDGEPIDHSGEFLRVTTGGFGRTGVPGAARVPVMVGTFSPRSLRVAAAHADGVMTWLAGPRVLGTEVRTTIDEAAAAAGRPRPHLVAGLPVAVTEDRERELARIEASLAPYVEFPAYADVFRRERISSLRDLAIVGTADEVEDRLGALEELGLSEFYGACASDDARTIENTVATLATLARRRGEAAPVRSTG
jgi:F420-dependent oxidoreductase-like protein